MSLAIQLKNVSKHFGDFVAVNDLSFEVHQGDIYGFLGPNGSGKSTTLRMIMGLIKNTNGEINLFGKSLKANRSDILREVGCIIEKPDFYNYLSAFENLQLFARANQLNLKKADFEQLLERVGLLGREKDKVKTYSHGMKQRLGLAQVLIHNPSLIILDEPNTGLDPQGIIDLRNLILSLNKEEGKTILFSSHILSEVQEMCSSMIVINKGKTIAQGKVAELLSHEKIHVKLEVIEVEKTMQLINQSSWKELFDKMEESIFVMNMSKDKIPALVSFLTLSGVSIERIDYRNQLEEYFLKITNQ
jgi:ABC-2 type transport system ATP-binding protein